MGESFLSGLSNAFSSGASWLSNGNNLANFGKVTGGLGSIYSAYNANKLGNKQVDLISQQNKLMLDAYNQDEEDKKKINTAFSSVWG